MQRCAYRKGFLSILLLTLYACAPAYPVFIPPAQDNTEIAPSVPTDLPVQSHAEVTETWALPIATQSPSPTAQLPTPTRVPLSYWISPEVPARLLDPAQIPSSLSRTEGAVDNALTLGLAERMPGGSVLLKEADYIFALVAPFKTVQDDVTASDLKAAWQGSPQGTTDHLTHIAVYEGDYHALVALLGGAPGGDVISETVLLLPDGLDNFSEHLSANVWAIVPFERLTPAYKVISLDGLSPLDDGFTQQSYPIYGKYALYTSEMTAQHFLSNDKDAFIAALPDTNRDESKLTTLVMTGVTALVRATAFQMENKGITYPARDIVDWLKAADITHISNEVSFYEDCPYPDPSYGGLNFCSHPKYIELFDFIGADVIELTGNHNNDSFIKYGVDVVPSTLELYAEHGMVTYAGGTNLVQAMQPALLDHNGNRLAFIGCNAFGPVAAWATDSSSGSAPCGDLEWMAAEVDRLKAEGYLVIATFQYYEDYFKSAPQPMKADFRKMAEAGAVIVNGSQAHLAKEMEIYNDALIHYGLGNLFFDQMTIEVNGKLITETRNEFIQRHVFYNGEYISTELLTAVLEDFAKPRPMTLEERQAFLEEIFSVR